MEKHFDLHREKEPIYDLASEIIPEAQEKVNKAMERLNKLYIEVKEARHIVTVPGTRTEAGESLDLLQESLKEAGEASVYFGINLCPSLCKYCRYENRTGRPERLPLMVKDTLQNLYLESTILQQKIHPEKTLPANSIYIGGGTPTLMTEAQMRILFENINKLYSQTASTEITMESTPETLTPEKITVMKNLGVNRISIGIQRLDDEWLAKMNRHHNTADVFRALEFLNNSGIRYNVDLMYGFGDQRVENFCNDILHILQYKPSEVTIYRFQSRKRRDDRHISVVQAIPKVSFVMQKAGREIFKQFGYYEGPSGWFNRPDLLRSQVYLDRWGGKGRKQKPLIGFGPWAYSYSGSQQHTNLPYPQYRKILATNQLPIDNERTYKYVGPQQELRRMVFDLKSNFNTDFKKDYANFFESLEAAELGIIISEGETQTFRLNEIGVIAVEEITEELMEELI